MVSLLNILIKPLDPYGFLIWCLYVLFEAWWFWLDFQWMDKTRERKL